MQCNASKDIQHAVSMITFAKNKKENMPRSSSSSLHEECYYYVARVMQLKLQMSCELLFMCENVFCILSFAL